MCKKTFMSILLVMVLVVGMVFALTGTAVAQPVAEEGVMLAQESPTDAGPTGPSDSPSGTEGEAPTELQPPPNVEVEDAVPAVKKVIWFGITTVFGLAFLYFLALLIITFIKMASPNPETSQRAKSGIGRVVLGLVGVFGAGTIVSAVVYMVTKPLG